MKTLGNLLRARAAYDVPVRKELESHGTVYLNSMSSSVDVPRTLLPCYLHMDSQIPSIGAGHFPSAYSCLSTGAYRWAIMMFSV